MAPPGEEHRDRHPRRPGRLKHHRQACPLSSAHQRGLLHGQQRFHRRHARRPADQPPISFQDTHRMPRRDPQINPDQPPVLRPAFPHFHQHLTVITGNTGSGGTARAARSPATVPGRRRPATAPIHVLQPGQTHHLSWPTSLMRVIRGQASSGNQIRETRPKDRPQNLRVATYRTNRGCSCNPGTPTLIKRRRFLT
jgi:hypothetical protein